MLRLRKGRSLCWRALDALHTHLTSNTYLDGHSISLADIITVCNLNLGFATVMTKNFTSEFPHVERYFCTVINQPNFKKVVGDVKQIEVVPPVASKKAAQPENPKKSLRKRNPQQQRHLNLRKRKRRQSPKLRTLLTCYHQALWY